MWRHLKLYGSFLRICAIREMEARGNFLVGSVLLSSISLLPLLFIGAIYGKTTSLGGWTLYQYLTIVGTFQIIYSLLFGIFARNMFDFLEQVRKGNLDFYLLKPVNTQFILSTRYVLFNELLGIVSGSIMIGISIVNLHLVVEWWRWPLYLLFVISGVITAYSIWFITIIPAIWVVKLDSPDVFISIFDVARYHPNMFNGFLRIILIYVFPIGIVVATPADLLMNRLDWPIAVWTLIVAVLLLFISNRFWRYAVRFYYGASA